MRKLLFSIILVLFVSVFTEAQQEGSTYQTKQFWQHSGNKSITWDITTETKLPHSYNIEMDGQKVAAIITYEVDKNKILKVKRDIIFPQLRIFIESSANNWRKYRAYLRDEYSDEFLPTITVGERTFEPGPLDSVRIAGILKFYHGESQGLIVERTLLPSMMERLFVEIWTIRNATNARIEIEIGKTEFFQEQQGQNGIFTRRIFSDTTGKLSIESGKWVEFAIYFSAQLNSEKIVSDTYTQVLMERHSFLEMIDQNLILETPDTVLNSLFAFSKIRAAESIYETKMGLVHSPGGGRYYTGVWANDQAEYSGPFFPYLGYDVGNKAAMNAYQRKKR